VTAVGRVRWARAAAKSGQPEAGLRYVSAMVKYVIALVIALALNAAANLMIKFGMRGIDMELSGASALSDGFAGLARLLLRHWILLAGLLCFALNVVFYAFALQKLAISVAYPIMVASGFGIIVTVAGFILGERLTPMQWIGVTAILLGVTLVAKDAGRQMGVSHDAPSVSQ
jgi:multidrug transporter EmrE-like cation transporter